MHGVRGSACHSRGPAPEDYLGLVLLVLGDARQLVRVSASHRVGAGTEMAPNTGRACLHVGGPGSLEGTSESSRVLRDLGKVYKSGNLTGRKADFSRVG